MITVSHTSTMSPSRANARTSIVEKALLGLIIVSLPLEDHIRIIPGYSLQFVMFGVVGLYLLLIQPSALLKTMAHPAFLAAYAFLVYSFAMEMTTTYPHFKEPLRIAQMIAGAILIASICRDIQGLKVALSGYMVAGLWLSVLLFLTSYGALQGAAAANFDEASRLRDELFEENPIEANLNSMAFAAGQGAMVALAWALMARTPPVRNFFLAVGLFCLVATFLPLSRGGVFIAFISCASVMYHFGLKHAKVMLIMAVLGGVVVTAVPEAVWSRMSVSFEERDGKREGRAKVFKAAIDSLPDYILTGVGSGNFWSRWGKRSDFRDADGRVTGSHNSFLQVTLYWGIGGLLGWLLIFWQAYRCLPLRVNSNLASLCLLGIAVSVLLYAQVIHNLYAKEFCLGLGLLVGARIWIWPQGIVPVDSMYGKRRIGNLHAVS